MADLGSATAPPDLGGLGYRRFWPWLVLALFLLPVGAVVLVFLEQRLDFRAAERAAEAQVASASPSPASWGVLGEVRLKQGRVAEALPLLERAAALERSGHGDARATLTLAQAEIAGARAGLAGASLAAAERALAQAEALAPFLPRGRRAGAWFSAGLFWQQLGFRERAVADLRKAVALQPDDWVEADGGTRYKAAGVAEYYQIMLAGALER